MYKFIESCKDPQDISYDKYYETFVVSVVAVVKGQKMPVSPTTAKNVPVVEKSPVVEDEPRGIEAELQQAAERARQKEEHDKEQAAKYTPIRPKSYSEMVQLVPTEYESPIEEKLCRAFRGLLARGIAPRLDMMVKETGLDEDWVRWYLDETPWIRKDDSSPAGVVVYLPSEASI